MSKHNKKPRVENIPQSPKNPRYELLPREVKEQSELDFRTGQMDTEGPWSWHSFKGLHLPEFLEHLFHSQKMTFQNLRDHGSHLVEIVDIIPGAQKRLMEIQRDDIDHLFSWRITGKKRVWCIKESNVLWLLWWDPEHQVCPSPKKHT